MTAINSPSLCGYYGKVPARADFVGARLRRETIERWDLWLQEGLAESQRRIGDAWHDLFFAAPIWRFILPVGACGRAGLMGILMSSVDSVGRCFPLMLGHEIEGPVDPLALMSGSGRWFAAAEDLALAALGEGFELDDLNRILPGWREVPHAIDRGALRPARLQGARGDVGAWMALPLASAATAMAAAATLAAGWAPGATAWPGIWWTAGTQSTASAPGLAPGLAISRGLVPSGGFAALLDGRWVDHGWTVPAAGRLERDDPHITGQGPGGGGDWERPV